MEPVTFICKRYPAYNIGGGKRAPIKFRLGKFVATRPWEVEVLENHFWFNVHIFKGKKDEDNPFPATPAAIHTGAERGEETLTHPPPGGDQTHISAAKSGEEAPPERVPPLAEAPPGVFGAPPGYVVSETAKGILEEAGIAVPVAAERLELSDGDRLTVKMAEGLVNG